MINHAQPTLSSAAASTRGAASPSLELLEARRARDGLATLLLTERAAAADFLLALADFDRRRGWEVLGYASLFAFLNVEMGLSKGGAFFRQAAARLLQRFPDLVAPLRDGRLCITTVVELSKVLTESNRAEVVPRFYRCTSQEAREVVAALSPMASPPVRALVTAAPRAVESRPVAQLEQPIPVESSMPAQAAAAAGAVQSTEPRLTHPARGLTSRDEVEPLTAELRRLHITVSRQFLKKVEASRAGLSHAIPGATMEQVLEVALDLLLEKQAKARGQVKRPRAMPVEAAPGVEEQAVDTQAQRLEDPAPSDCQRAGADGQLIDPVTCSNARPEGRAIDPPTTEPRPPRREGPRGSIPVAVRRAVWARDQGRCSWPLDGGGRCGSTHRLEFDHVVPWARGGVPTVAGLRLLCRQHNALAARQAFGTRCVGRYAGGAEAGPWPS